MLVLLCRYSFCEGIIRVLEVRRKIGEVEVCEVQGVALIVFVNLPLWCQVSYRLSEDLGGVELADGVCPHHTQKHSNTRTSSVVTNIGGMNVNDCGGEPVSGERPLCVCSVVLCSLRQSHSENPLLALGQSCKHNTSPLS